MSILKMINERHTDKKRLQDKYSYLTAASKTDNGKLVGASNCITKRHIDEMLTVKRLYHKDGGRCWVEFTLSLTPDRKDIRNEDYLEIAQQVADLFPEFQIVFTVHLDSSIRHIHFMMNTVSVYDGHKFSQSPSDLSNLKLHTNEIILSHGFDIIKLGADEILDLTDYSDAINFEYLEINEEVFKPKSITVKQEINISEQGIDIADFAPVRFDYPFFSNERSILMNPYYNGTITNEPEENQVIRPSEPENTALVSQTPMPITGQVEQTRQTISFNISRKHIVHHPSNDLTGETIASLHELGRQNMQDLNSAANFGIALVETLAKHGHDIDIVIDASVQTESYFGNHIQINPAGIIDAEYTEADGETAEKYE